MMLRIKFLLWVCWSLCLTSCSNAVSQNASSQMASQNIQPAQHIVEVNSRVEEKVSPLWKLSRYRIGSKESLQALHFSDSDNGWIASYEGSLYKTTNGGKTWQKVNTNISPGARISSIFFINSTVGWVTVIKISPSILDYEANQGWIMKTSDGGQSWVTQHSGKAIGFNRILFVNENEGWAAGIKTIGLSPLRQVHYILHTTNQGENWEDVSDGLNRTASNEKGRVQDQATDLYAANPSNVTLLSLRGKIFNSDDGGKTWRNIVNIPNEPGQTCICRLGKLNDSSLWVSGGADSTEGTWGMMAKRASNNSWTRYRLPGIYFRDAIYISENQAIASGSISSGNGSRQQEREEGIILYSSDGGQNWTYIYKDAGATNIHALYTIDSDHIWAVGENGLIVQLERTQDSAAQQR